MPDTLHIAEPGDTEEVSLARAVALLGVTPDSPATFLFDGRGDLPSAWKLWQETWLAPHLAPSFVEAYECGVQYWLDEIQAIDTLLDLDLTDQVRERSKQAAAAFLEGKSEMQANREGRNARARQRSFRAPVSAIPPSSGFRAFRLYLV